MHLNHREHGIQKIERIPRADDPRQTQFKVFFNKRADMDRFLLNTPDALTWEDVIKMNQPGFSEALKHKIDRINERGYVIAVEGGKELLNYRECSVIVKEMPEKLEYYNHHE